MSQCALRGSTTAQGTPPSPIKPAESHAPWAAQDHIFAGGTTAQGALDAAFAPPLVDFDVVLALRAASVPGSQLGLQVPSQPPHAEPADKSSAALLQAVPYGKAPASQPPTFAQCPAAGRRKAVLSLQLQMQHYVLRRLVTGCPAGDQGLRASHFGSQLHLAA